jgi:hypothetical protein
MEALPLETNNGPEPRQARNGIIALAWSLKSIDAETGEAHMAEIAIDVIGFVITERLPGPHPHSKAGENASRRDDRKRNPTREAGERPLR